VLVKQVRDVAKLVINRRLVGNQPNARAAQRCGFEFQQLLDTQNDANPATVIQRVPSSGGRSHLTILLESFPERVKMQTHLMQRLRSERTLFAHEAE
jgi:RimJ/RimL family protein N-acetyltransferase